MHRFLSCFGHTWTTLRATEAEEPQYISVQLHATALLFFSASVPLWLTGLWTTLCTPLSPPLPLGRWWVDGSGGIPGCSQKKVGLERGGGLLSQAKFQVANSWQVSAAGSISNQRPLTAPLQPNPGNPINCVRQRELVSIDPHSAGLWLAHKGHSHVETNAGAEKPRGGPDSAALAPLPQMWSCVSSPLIKQETPIEKVCLPNQTLHSPLPVQTGTAFIFYQVFMLTPWRAALIDWLKMQGLLTRGNKTPSLWSIHLEPGSEGKLRKVAFQKSTLLKMFRKKVYNFFSLYTYARFLWTGVASGRPLHLPFPQGSVTSNLMSWGLQLRVTYIGSKLRSLSISWCQ